MSSKKQSIKNKNTTKRKLPKKNKLICNPNIKDGVVRGSCLPVNILHILKK